MVCDDTALCATTLCAVAAKVYHMVNRHQSLTHDYSCGLDTVSMLESLCHRIHTNTDAGNVLSDTVSMLEVSVTGYTQIPTLAMFCLMSV